MTVEEKARQAGASTNFVSNDAVYTIGKRAGGYPAMHLHSIYCDPIDDEDVRLTGTK